MLGILRGKRVIRDEFAKPFMRGPQPSVAQPCCSTAKGQTFDAHRTTGAVTVIRTRSRQAVPGSLAPVPWAASADCAGTAGDGDAEWRTVLRRSAPGAAKRRARRCRNCGLTAGGGDRSSSSICSMQRIPTRTALALPRRLGTFPGRVGSRMVRSVLAAWRTLRTSIAFLAGALFGLRGAEHSRRRPL